MELQNVIDECEINYKVGDQVIYSYLDKEIRELYSKLEKWFYETMKKEVETGC